MSVLYQRIKLSGSKDEFETEALFDGGATYSVIRKDIVEKLENLTKMRIPLKFRTAKEGAELTATEKVVLDFYIDNTRFSDEFIVIENLDEEVIIGAKTMQSWRFKLDYENERVLFDPKVTKLIII